MCEDCFRFLVGCRENAQEALISPDIFNSKGFMLLHQMNLLKDCRIVMSFLISVTFVLTPSPFAMRRVPLR